MNYEDGSPTRLTSNHTGKAWSPVAARPPQRRKKGYGRGAQRSVSYTMGTNDFTKRKKRALQERQYESFDDSALVSDDRASTGSLESSAHSGSSVSSIDTKNVGPAPVEPLHRQVLSDIDKISGFPRRPSSAYTMMKSLSYFDTENIHPNIKTSEEQNHHSPLPPSKVKKILPSPFHKQKFHESEISMSSIEVHDSSPNKRFHLGRSNSIASSIDVIREHKRAVPLMRSSSLRLPSGRQSPAFSNASSISSFSSLAKTGNLAPSWVAKSLEKASEAITRRNSAYDSDQDTLDMSITPCNNDPISDLLSPPQIKSEINISNILESPSTPERIRKPSPAESCRKRSVCDSPNISLEDMSLSYPLASRASRLCTARAMRSRSRSRLFPQNTESETVINTPPVLDRRTSYNPSPCFEQIRNSDNEETDDDDDSYHDGKDHGSDDETKEIFPSSSGELSFTDSIDGHRDNHPFPKQAGQCVQEESDSGSFKKSLFQLISPAGQQSLKNKKIDMKKISSYRDLKYIVQSLHKVKSSNSIAGFGARTWTVVVPQLWSPSRKAGFLQWVTSGLGFCLRRAGGISLLVITCERGSEVLEHLDVTLNKLKMRSRGENEEALYLESHSINILCQPNMGLPSDLKSDPIVKVSTNVEIEAMAAIPPFFPKTNSSVVRSEKKNHTSTVNVKVSPVDQKVEVQLLDDFGNLTLNNEHVENDDIIDLSTTGPPSSKCKNEENSTPLVRIITLDHTNTHSSIKSSRCSFSPKDTSFEIHRRTRLSGEHVQGSRELLMHCHGLSPPCSNERPRPTRLNISKNLVPKCSHDMLSPYTADSDRSYSAAGTHHSCLTSVFTYETIETPMPRRCARTWGSRPINGKDWGISAKCEPAIISLLLQRFGGLLSEYDGQIEDSSIFHSCSWKGHSYPDCFADPHISVIAANTADLGFDREVDTSVDETNYLENKSNIFMHDNKNGKEHTVTDERNFVQVSDVDPISSPIEQLGSRSTVRTEKKKRLQALAKHRRISLCTPFINPIQGRRSFETRGSIVSGLNHSYIGSPFCPRTLMDTSLMKFPYSSIDSVANECIMNHQILCNIFSFLNEESLFCQVSLVCTKWADAATSAHAYLAIASIGCDESDSSCDDESSIDEQSAGLSSTIKKSISKSMEKSLSYFVRKFPFGSFLSEGSFKQVFRVWNSDAEGEEAISIMDVNMIESTGNLQAIGSELSTCILLSSLARRNICPNFVTIRGVFTSQYKPPAERWFAGNSTPSTHPSEPTFNSNDESVEIPVTSKGMYQYIRMELCKYGDVEEFINNQPNKVIHPNEARNIFFQMAFSLHTAGDRFGLKHYDVKLLNFLLQSANKDSIDEEAHPHTVLRYGFGAHVFSLRMSTSRAFIAKLADFGTANMKSECEGQPITLGQFTTLENSPPEFMICGDNASQGYGHDCFGLGLCMLHLFTGHGPYEEILEEVKCPPTLHKKLRKLWQNKESSDYEVIKSVILADVYEDEDGNIVGEPDDILYHTLYRYLVLFGIPKDKFKLKEHGKIWRTITSSLEMNKRGSSSAIRYKKDASKFSFLHGNDPRIVAARTKLQRMQGGLDLLMGLVSFDPEKRFTPLDVINSVFMEPLREISQESHCHHSDIVHSFMAYKTHHTSQ